jgi:aryl-alcohol dehydrogenase-like predicted oxidoreductase
MTASARHVGDVPLFPIGLGAQNLSVAGRPDRATAIATIHAALDAGVTLIDTSDAYTTEAEGQGHNELLVREALGSYGADTSHVLVATKGGLVFRDEGPWDRVGTPEHLHEAARASLARLGRDAIDLYHYHRPDPKHDFADSVGALRELLDEGIIRRVGLSNVTVDQVELAQRILDGRVASIENQFSPGARVHREVMAHAAEHGIAYLLWGPLDGVGKAGGLRQTQPAFGRVADELGVSVYRVVLAWELRQSSTTIPIPGAMAPGEIADSAAAADLELDAEQLAALDADPESAAA